MISNKANMKCPHKTKSARKLPKYPKSNLLGALKQTLWEEISPKMGWVSMDYLAINLTRLLVKGMCVQKSIDQQLHTYKVLEKHSNVLWRRANFMVPNLNIILIIHSSIFSNKFAKNSFEAFKLSCPQMSGDCSLYRILQTETKRTLLTKTHVSIYRTSVVANKWVCFAETFSNIAFEWISILSNLTVWVSLISCRAYCIPAIHIILAQYYN